LEESLRSLAILDRFSDADRQVLYEVAAVTFKGMLKRPQAPFVLILDGLDENRFFSRLKGMEFLSNQLADFKCPVVLTTRAEHLDAMFGDFSTAFQEFSVKLGPKRDARLIVLQPWTIRQARRLCTEALRKTKGRAREHLNRLTKIFDNRSYSRLYGDLPTNPLMLQFIIEDVAENGIRKSNRSALLESWIRRKIRRDQSRVDRVKIAEDLDVEEITDQLLLVMEDVAARMLDLGTHELIETIESREAMNCAASRFPSVNLLGLILHSLLIPVRARQGSSLPLAFAFRVVQEYFLARYLVHSQQDSSPFGESIRGFVKEIESRI
jgi:hypothetical protein